MEKHFSVIFWNFFLFFRFYSYFLLAFCYWNTYDLLVAAPLQLLVSSAEHELNCCHSIQFYNRQNLLHCVSGVLQTIFICDRNACKGRTYAKQCCVWMKWKIHRNRHKHPIIAHTQYATVGLMLTSINILTMLHVFVWYAEPWEFSATFFHLLFFSFPFDSNLNSFTLHHQNWMFAV